jgi:hypothetical protein
MVRGSFQLEEECRAAGGVAAAGPARGGSFAGGAAYAEGADTDERASWPTYSATSAARAAGIISAILEGERDPGKLAELCDRRPHGSWRSRRRPWAIAGPGGQSAESTSPAGVYPGHPRDTR